MKKLINRTSRFFYNHALGLLLIRLGVGLLFLAHGWSKVQSAYYLTQFVGAFGLPLWFAFFVAWLEVIGGLALILGVAVRFFAFLFAIEMIAVIAFIGFSGGVDIEPVLALIAFGLAFTGAGKYSIFKMGCHHCGGILCRGESGICIALT